MIRRDSVDQMVFEHVGTATWDESVASLALGGRLVTCGATTGFDAKIDLRFLFSRQLSLLGSYMGAKSELQTVMKLVAAGRLKPLLWRAHLYCSLLGGHVLLRAWRLMVGSHGNGAGRSRQSLLPRLGGTRSGRIS